jgi:peptidase inhibitor family I36
MMTKISARSASVGGLALAFILVGACQDQLPSAPSELTQGIIIYADINFVGKTAHVTGDVNDLQDFDGPCEKIEYSGSNSVTTTTSWDDCISSVRVAPGWRATLYEDPDFKGWAADVGEENVANYELVRGPCSHDAFNDCASSIRVFRR